MKERVQVGNRLYSISATHMRRTIGPGMVKTPAAPSHTLTCIRLRGGDPTATTFTTPCDPIVAYLGLGRAEGTPQYTLSLR
jgi:hypothetical protein